MKVNPPAFLLLMIVNVTLAAAQTAPIPTVVSVKGKASIKQSKTQDDKEAKPIKAGDALPFGHWVICGQNCKEVQISYCHFHTKIIRGGSHPIRIVHMGCNITSRGTIGGGAKGTGPLITYPRNDALVRPETFSVKWDTNYSLPINGISINILLVREIWKAGNLDWKAGLYESESLREKLKGEQQAGRLKFVLIPKRDGGNEPAPVVFFLISAQDEHDLNLRLADLEDESDTILRTIGRGLVFHEFKLDDDAIEELEKALTMLQSQKPNKMELEWAKRLVITANESVDNDARVTQLCSSLKNLDSMALPAACIRRSGHD
ncbi:MAG TPA: hypothetical protein VK582_06565 [Pyrinomonadaceae bacterium]|nr:hypothetical protein [Pyrinomonadaceae bacterium]